MSPPELERELAAGVAFWGYEGDRGLVGVMGIAPGSPDHSWDPRPASPPGDPRPASITARGPAAGLDHRPGAAVGLDHSPGAGGPVEIRRWISSK